jgi:hypothetical protein
LAWGASHEKVNWAVAIKHLLRDLGHVTHIREPEAVLDNGGRERLYLARP